MPAPSPSTLIQARSSITRGLGDTLTNARTGQSKPCRITVGVGRVAVEYLPRSAHPLSWKITFSDGIDFQEGDVLTGTKGTYVVLHVRQPTTVSVASVVEAVQIRLSGGLLNIPYSAMVKFQTQDGKKTTGDIQAFLDETLSVEQKANLGLTESEWTVLTDTGVQYSDGTVPRRGHSLLWSGQLDANGDPSKLPLTKVIRNLWPIPAVLHAFRNVN